MDVILSLLSGPALGGIGGILASMATGLMGFFKRQQSHKHELALRKADIEMMQAEHKHTLRMMDLEADMRAAELDTSSFTRTLEHDSMALETNGAMLLEIAEFIRRTFRPFMTASLIFACVLLFFSGLATEPMRAEMLKALAGATTMAVSWWFCDRSIKKHVG